MTEAINKEIIDDVQMDYEEEPIKEKKKEEKKPQIEDLPGVGPSTAEKLKMSGYDTVMAIAVATPGQLTNLVGTSESASRKMINFARECLNMGFESGLDVLRKRSSITKIGTGCEGFDQLLGGGFETGAITECFGEFGSGKTQIGHALAVNMINQNPNSYAVYIDTENTFRPERIIQLAEGSGQDPEYVLSHIKVARAYNSDHQMLLVDKVSDIINNEELDVKLVVVDSLTAHFRAEFIGRGTLSERQQKLNKHMHGLLKIADTHNLCVYVTNQVMSRPDTFFGDPTAAIGGHVVAHASTFRIYLRKGKKGSRVAKLVDSPNLPESEVAFIVETSGLKEF